MVMVFAIHSWHQKILLCWEARKLSVTYQCLDDRRFSRFGFHQFFASTVTSRTLLISLMVDILIFQMVDILIFQMVDILQKTMKLGVSSFKCPRYSVCSFRRQWNIKLRTSKEMLMYKGCFCSKILALCGKFWNIPFFNGQNILLTFFCIGIKSFKQLTYLISVNYSLFFLCHNICHVWWSEKEPKQTNSFQEKNTLIALSNIGVFI